MKTRERVELSLKTIAAVLVGIALIFLMEGMIYNIYMSKINDNKASQFIPKDCIAYCEEVGEDEYKVYLHNTEYNSWSVRASNFSLEQIEKTGYGEIVLDVPNAFDVNINTTHYIVMAVFILAIIGFYGWRFYKLDGDYKKLEKRLRVKGTIF